MASDYAVAHRRQVRKLRSLRKRKVTMTADERSEHERAIVRRLVARYWTPWTAHRLDLEWDTNPPAHFTDYSYWQARKAGWELLPQLLTWHRTLMTPREWEWWCGLDWRMRKAMAAAGVGRFLHVSTEEERVNLERMFGGNCVVDRKNLATSEAVIDEDATT